MGKTDIRDVFGAISEERDYQDKRWGTDPKNVATFLTYMRHWLTKAEQDCTKEAGNFDALNQVRKVTALGVACMQQNGVVTREMVP